MYWGHVFRFQRALLVSIEDEDRQREELDDGREARATPSFPDDFHPREVASYDDRRKGIKPAEDLDRRMKGGSPEKEIANLRVHGNLVALGLRGYHVSENRAQDCSAANLQRDALREHDASR